MALSDTAIPQGNAYRRLFGNRSFVALWVGQMISFIGDYCNYLAIPIMVNRLTGSAMMVGLAVMATALPALLLGPIAGVFVDRWDRKWTMIISDVLRGVIVLSLLLVRSVDQVWIFYVEGFLVSCVSQFFFPARNAVLPLIVKEQDDLLPANGLMQVIQMFGLLAGPALAGFAIGLWGERIAFIANSAGYFASAAVLTLMVVPRTTSTPPGSGNRIQEVRAELLDGLVYLFGHRSTLGVLICMSVAMLGFGAIQVIWVPYLQSAFGVGATGLGIVDSIQGAGMLVGGVLLGFVAGKVSKTTLGSGGICLLGLGFAAMGFAPTFTILIAISFVVGLAIVPAESALSTIMQLAVPDLKRGRVSSSLGAVTTAASLVSMGLASTFGEAIGLSNVYAFTGLLVFIAGLLGFWLLKEPEGQAA